MHAQKKGMSNDCNEDRSWKISHICYERQSFIPPSAVLTCAVNNYYWHSLQCIYMTTQFRRDYNLLKFSIVSKKT